MKMYNGDVLENQTVHEHCEIMFRQHPFEPDIAVKGCHFVDAGIRVKILSRHDGIGHVLFRPNSVFISHNHLSSSRA